MATFDGDRLRQARLDIGLSQKKLAAAAGFATPVIGRWERGDAQPSAGALHQLAFALEVDVGSLLRGPRQPTASLAGMREEAGLSEGLVAAAVGVSVTVYRQMERGWFHDDVLVHKVAVVLGLPVSAVQAAIDNE